ncbi:MAG: hypothetical protein JO353_14100, partial [Phycisphaerae bacterium]|nr:hypothetical protein [Phycisphaerae bacterium]
MGRITASDILQFSVGELPKKVADAVRAPRPAIQRTVEGDPIDAVELAKQKQSTQTAPVLSVKRKPLSGLVPNADRLTGSLPKMKPSRPAAPNVSK